MPIIISFRKDIVIEVGAIDKSFLYDNIGRKVNKSNQVKYYKYSTLIFWSNMVK